MRRGITRALAELSEGVRIALSTLLGNRLRSFLTTLGIVIGVMTVIAIVAIVQGLNQSFEAQVANLGTKSLYVQKWKWVMLESEWYLLRNRKPITLAEFRAVERESRLATAVSPMVFARATAARGGVEMSGVTVAGVGTGYLESAGGAVSAGRFLVESDVELDRPVAVLGAEVVDVLFPGIAPEAVLGSRILVAGRPFAVVGLLARKGRFLGMNMDKRLLMPFGTFGRIFGMKRSISIAAAAPPGKVTDLEDELTGILRRARAVPPGKADDFSINRQEQLLKIYEGITGALYGVAIGVGLITLVVGGIGIMNIMMVSVHERTREIGLRRALGARKRTILAQFMLEASMVAVLGGAVGTALGLAVAQFIALATPLAAAVTPSAVALGLGFSAAVGILFGSWPAWRAANLDPVEALRYE
jgi:putative ABC transport system permease protein